MRGRILRKTFRFSESGGSFVDGDSEMGGSDLGFSGTCIDRMS